MPTQHQQAKRKPIDGRTPVRPSAVETRQRLITAGRAAFAEKGHDGVSLQNDVLKPAGVSVGSFYHQFRDKTELLAEVLTTANANAQAVLDSRRSAPAHPTDAATSFTVFLDIADVAEDLIRIQLRERDNPDPRIRELIAETRSQWLEYLEARYRLFESPDSEFRAAIAARVVSALSLGTMIQYLDMAPEERAGIRQSLIDGLTAFTIGGFARMGAKMGAPG